MGKRHPFIYLFVFCILIAPLAHARYSSLVMDYNTGEIAEATRADIQRYPASLTKMMTLYLVFEKLKRQELTMDTKVCISRRCCRVPPSKLYLKPKDHLSLKDAIYALAIKSANDVAIAVAETVSGSEKKFVKEMNKKARELGMTKTHFVNASGLPNPHQLSTAKDMAVLGRAMIKNHPEFLHIFETQHFQFRGRKYTNSNHLLGKVKGVYGIKTGYTRRAGWNIAVAYNNDHKHVICVVMGEMSAHRRDHRAQCLVEGKKVTLQDYRRLSRPKSKGRKASRLKNWAVQVGVFRNKKQAERYAKQLAQEHQDLIQKSMLNKLLNIVRHRRNYKARFKYKDHQQALEFCDKLKQNGTDCFVVKSQ